MKYINVNRTERSLIYKLYEVIFIFFFCKVPWNVNKLKTLPYIYHDRDSMVCTKDIIYHIVKIITENCIAIMTLLCMK